MSKELTKLEIEKVFLSDAAEIVAARAKAIIIHHTKDIDTAGNEVERAVRKVLRRKLPSSYYVGHGHIVDSQLVNSQQFDVIIADNSRAPVLFQTEDETEYFPYESVYALGEVKSTYYKSKNYIQSFIDSLSQLRSNLHRDKVPPTYLQTGGLGLDVEFLPMTDNPFQNPLFSFMLVVDSGDFKLEDIVDVYSNTAVGNLPNVLCFLDKGLVIYAKILISSEKKGFNPHVIPEFVKEQDEKSYWVFAPFGSGDSRIGAHLGFLYYLLLAHLGSSVLKPPNILSYLQQMFFFRAKDAKVIGELDLDGV
jgi:hypothetical protein